MVSTSTLNLYRDRTTEDARANSGAPGPTVTLLQAQGLPSQERGFSLTYDTENNC